MSDYINMLSNFTNVYALQINIIIDLWMNISN